MPSGTPILVELDGAKVCLTELARRFGLSQATVHHRWTRGERDIKKLTRPADQRYTRRGVQ